MNLSDYKNPRVRFIRSETASDFLDLLAPRTGLFESGEVFRGHGDSSWKLLPSAFRKILDGRVRDLSHSSTYMAVAEWEARTLIGFVNHLDSHGYETPGDANEVLNEANLVLYADITKKPYEKWPPDSVLRVLSLAQHYGVPTRLLDWTRSSKVAAYFAATDCLKQHSPPEFLAVWAANTFAQGRFEPGIDLLFRALPQFENANLRAQKGVMMVFRQFREMTQPFLVKSFDECIEVKFGATEPSSELAYTFVTLPSSEASVLLRLLSAPVEKCRALPVEKCRAAPVEFYTGVAAGSCLEFEKRQVF